jgi:catechol 2,3-dioxygenase-like lactoylglutathione lyase family enzyme
MMFILPFILSVVTAQGVKRPRITGISHIAVFTQNMDSSFAFYKDFLGFEEPFRLTKADNSLSTVFIKVNDLQCIELFPEREKGTDRLYQVALITDDAEAVRARLAAAGVKVPAKVGTGRIGNANFTCKDPDGHTVEIVQYEPDGWTMRDAGKHMSDARVSARLKHIGFAVYDLDRAMKFYRDILGFQETWRGSRDNKQLSWVNMKVPDGDEYLEFMLYQDPPTMEKLGGMNHLSLEVADIQKAVDHLEARPARATYLKKYEVKTGINRKRQINLFDPDGTRTEIMEQGTVDGTPTPSSAALPPR